MPVCDNCGKKFLGKRTDAKYCSSGCRVEHHRKKDRAAALTDQIFKLMSEMSELVYDDDNSYDAAIGFNGIQQMVNFYRAHDAGSWWRCKKCQTAVRRTLPDNDSCQCGKSAQWVLQRTMI